jgi:hypothetical protein
MVELDRCELAAKLLNIRGDSPALIVHSGKESDTQRAQPNAQLSAYTPRSWRALS